MRLDRPSAAHLLRRGAMSGVQGNVASFFGMQHEAAVDRLLDTSVTSALPGWARFADDDDWGSQNRMIEWWVDRMIADPPTIEEKVMLFLHSHFATGREKVQETRLMWDQHVQLRRHGLGSFRTLLDEIEFGSAMLIYLDNETNVAGAEQENFARELMELHTVGNGNFSESDVVAMARAWTGHNTVGATKENNWKYDPTYIFRAEDHDNGNKTLFGKTENWDASDTLDELCTGAKAVATSEFIARKAFEFFIHDHPSASAISELGSTFRNSGLEVRALVRAVLLRDEFWDPSTRYTLIKSPVEYMVDIMRRCGLRSKDVSVRWRMEGMGMTLFDPPTVAGWGTNEFWLSTASAWAKSKWILNLKWDAEERNLLQGLEDLTVDEAVSRITNFYGIYDPSPQSVQHLGDLVRATKEEHVWAMDHEPFAAGLFMPEVQCA